MYFYIFIKVILKPFIRRLTVSGMNKNILILNAPSFQPPHGR